MTIEFLESDDLPEELKGQRAAMLRAIDELEDKIANAQPDISMQLALEMGMEFIRQRAALCRVIHSLESFHPEAIPTGVRRHEEMADALDLIVTSAGFGNFSLAKSYIQQEVGINRDLADESFATGDVSLGESFIDLSNGFSYIAEAIPMRGPGFHLG